MAKPRILIVEDETIVAMDLATTLRRLGYEVVAMVGTGAAAIEHATSLKPDLILMDIRIRGPMDGIETASKIHQQRPTPIVFLTAHGDADTVERSKAASPYGYLVKPFEERMLHRVLEIALSRAAAETAARDQTLDALWKSEERFRLLVQSVRDYALFLLDKEGRIVSWNTGAEKITGFTEEDVLGKSVTMLRPAEQNGEENLARLLQDVLTQGGAEWDETGIRKDGTRYIPHVYCTPMFDRNRELLGFVSVTRDMTEQRNLEAQLVQTQRLESLGQLAGGIAHDFNNMLMVIFARCDILLRTAKSEKDRQFIRDIRSAAMKNRDLTQQLLAAARQQVLEPQVVNLNSVIRSALQLLGPTLGEHIAIDEQLDERLWNVHADPGKLHQVLLNLAINARDAMPNGGRLTIETRNVQVDASYARQHIGLREGSYILLAVTDTGTGIAVAIRDRIYDPFFTTKDPGHGTGLGLAVVRGIVEQTGGRTWVYSEEGRGTTFKIFLPRHALEGSVPQEPDESRPERGTETILLVEDEELLRAVVREELEEHGYRVLEVRHGAEALSLSESLEERIDLLLTDVIMPGMTGSDLAARIGATRPDTKIIFMSGYTNQAILNHTALPASVRYLEKPIPASLLLRTIRAVLDERRLPE
jgi:PAS domain S-box-containing protein